MDLLYNLLQRVIILRFIFFLAGFEADDVGAGISSLNFPDNSSQLLPGFPGVSYLHLLTTEAFAVTRRSAHKSNCMLGAADIGASYTFFRKIKR